MKVVFASSEIYPFAKTGGLADISGSLPKEIAKKGLKVFGFMPLYKSVDLEKHKIKSINVFIDVFLNGRNYTFEVYKLIDNVTFFFLKNDELFGRDYLYGTPEGDYPDNDIRFGAFSYAVMEFIRKEELNPDIIHVNDWQTSLIPVLTYYKYNWHNVRTVLTIHNLAYQGIFDKFAIERLNLGWDLFHMEALEFYDKVNFLKGGIVFSSAITTVSPTYAKEILKPEYGFGLDGLLRKYENKLYGIINGIDYNIWNPETDKHIYEKFCEYTIEKKLTNKKLFLKEFGLEEDKPLFVFIGRFAQQKGIDLIKDTIEELSKLPINLAILGSGDRGYNDFFESIKGKYENIFTKVGYDESISRKMYASGDFLLMPSLFEPCGLNQMIAMRYGTLVVARRTGGLNDTVKDISQPDGYGILFDNPDKHEFLNAINRAIDLYNNKQKFSDLQRKVMGFDFSIESTAQKYIKLYESIKYSREVIL
ncbi:glycogen synthase [Sulfurihydrogenibium subterraneum]|uniref:glycogen synthase n=1 Tax=Sulfurihydrogenibium subterraneum TaxID=171121 RepID=UPI00048A4A1B|nr:glycogen/starch synthase [Sulfurihydrogenibium subterraneum]